MLLRDSKWLEIRAQFSKEEMEQLSEAVTGQVICPRGAVLDEDKLSEELREKLREAVRVD